MRIISGEFKGRRFSPPNGFPTRPTTDTAKEGLFNIIENNWDIADIKYLDLYAGTGNLSYEMASRGCQNITAIDTFQGCITFIDNTTKLLSIESIQAIKMDVFKFIGTTPEKYDIIIADPPYSLPNIDEIPDRVLDSQLLNDEGWLILEHNPDHKFDDHPHFFHKRNYGSTIFSFFR